MPLPTHLLFLFASGLVCALAARAELRASDQALTSARPLAAYALYLALIALPCSLYFYLFHRDWYLLYLVAPERGWIGLLVLLLALELALGVGGFLLGARLVRRERERSARALAAVSLLASISLPLVPALRARIAHMGSYAEFQGALARDAIGGTLLYGMLWMSLWMLIALGILAHKLGPGARRV